MNYAYRTMSVMSLFDTLASEEACEKYLMNVRWPDGMVCKHCGKKDFSMRKHYRPVKTSTDLTFSSRT
jgi:hypothetical protein